MPDEITPPAAPPAAPPSTPPAPPAAPPAGKTFTEAEVEARIAERLAAKADADKKAAEIEDAKKRGDYETASKADKERADKAESKAKDLAAKTDVLSNVLRLKIVDADAAHLFIKDQVKFDAEGNPTNVGALLDQLVKDKPYLVEGAAGSSTSAANPGGGREGSFSLDAIKKMSTAQINANWDKPGFQEALKKLS